MSMCVGVWGCVCMCVCADVYVCACTYISDCVVRVTDVSNGRRVFGAKGLL